MKVRELVEILKTCDQEAKIETAYMSDGLTSGQLIVDVMQVEQKVDKKTIEALMRE